MPNFVHESNARGVADPSRLLYGEFRSAFVHGYPQPQYAWGRKGPRGKYWFNDKKGRLVLNIDQLVAGFIRGTTKFKQLAATDPDLRGNFIAYTTR
jgi:hypothetical protein